MKKETKNTVAALGVGAAVLVGSAVFLGGSGSNGDDWNADGGGGGGGGGGFDFGSLFDGIAQQEQDFWDQMPNDPYEDFPDDPYGPSLLDEPPSYPETPTPTTPTPTATTSGGFGLLDGLMQAFTPSTIQKASSAALYAVSPTAGLGGALGQSAGMRIADSFKTRNGFGTKLKQGAAETKALIKNNGGSRSDGTGTTTKKSGGGFGKAFVRNPTKKESSPSFGSGGIGGGFGGGGGGLR